MTKLPAKLRPLQPYLVGSPRTNGEWDMHCPLHEDVKRSASLNVKQGVFYCFAKCGGCRVDELLEQRADWRPSPNGSSPATMNGEAEDLPSMNQVREWRDALLADDDRLDRFVGKRGLYTQTVSDRFIGWDDGRGAYTIPVFDFDGGLLTVRFYNMGAQGGRKFWSLKGRGGAFLYPALDIKSSGDEIIVCEGELDALLLIQAGFAAVTRTGAAEVWMRGWNKHFKNKNVYLCHDADEAGQKANAKVGTHLSKVAHSVRTIQLPYPIGPDHGKDVTDFFMERHGTEKKAIAEFRELMNEAQLFSADVLKPRKADPSDVDMTDVLAAEHVGNPVQTIATVFGKAKGMHTVPSRVGLSCDRDAGAMCNSCPMFDSGRGEVEVERWNPVILKMVNVKTEDVDALIKSEAGIPRKCPKVVMDKQYQSVQNLFIRPSVEHVNGNRQEFGTIKVTSVGSHAIPTNATVQIIGAHEVNPKTQESEFQAWHIQPTRALDEEFILTPDVIDSLKKFQSPEGDDPLEKLKEISDELALHVTHIYGRPHLHAVMDLVWHSVLQFRFNGQLLKRGWLEALIVGDTRTGKSEVAERLVAHYRAGEMLNCEAASFAGVIGGTQQIRNEWTLTWGAIPINDRRLVVLDEISGLSVDEIGSMSSVRSSGEAAITKVVQDKTNARTRLIWMGNPREDLPMSTYTYGVHAIRPLIGRREDIARFDLAMSLRADDVDVKEIVKRRTPEPQKYDKESCSNLVRWVWTRRPKDVIWEDGAERMANQRSVVLGSKYISEPPLILPADVRTKIARVAVALAARLFSTRTGGDLYVTKAHVAAAIRFIDALYSQPTFGYATISERRHSDQHHAHASRDEATKFIKRHPQMVSFLADLEDGRFYRRDLEEVLNMDIQMANGVLSRLLEFKMIAKDGPAVRTTKELLEIVKELV